MVCRWSPNTRLNWPPMRFVPCCAGSATELLLYSRMMTPKRPALFLFGFLSLTLLAAAGSTSRSFEGKWVLDKKSQGASAAPQDLVQQIKVDGSQMIIRSK